MADGGEPVSHVGYTVNDVSLHGAVVRAACVGAVCTRESARGRNCAAQLMEDAVARAREEGVSLLMVSGGRGLYRRMGCVDAGLYGVHVLEKGFRAPAAGSCAAADWTEADLPALQALHQAERVRFIRDAGAMRTLLSCGMLMCRPGRTFVVRVDGAVTAYACVSPPNDHLGSDTARVREIGGSRAAVLAAAPAIMDAVGARRLEIESAADDAEWQCMARTAGLSSSPHGFDGTVKIVDREAFFRAIKGYIAERLTLEESRDLAIECGHAVTFSLGAERFTVTEDGDLAALAFGSVERAVPSAEGRLGGILRRLFPLPLPWYGLNYS